VQGRAPIFLMGLFGVIVVALLAVGERDVVMQADWSSSDPT
jgi:hypothetical protein